MVKAPTDSVKTKTQSTRQDPGKRLAILTGKEIEELYGFPQFTDADRQKYFYLSQAEQKVVASLKSTKAKIHFILQLGYFKDKRLFFVFDERLIQDDIHYVIQQYFPHLLPLGSTGRIRIPKRTRIRQEGKILKLFIYHPCNDAIQKKLYQRAVQAARVCVKPIYLFRELMTYLEHHQVMLPGYSTMQDIIGKTLTNERKRLLSLVRQDVPTSIKSALEMLLTAEAGLYEITLLKREAQDFSYSQIKQEVHRRQTLKPLYDFANAFLLSLEISHDNIRYYASLVEYYSVYKLKRMRSEPVYLYLLCFVFSRFQKINDNLIQSFVYHVSKYEDEAKTFAKQCVYEFKVEGYRNLKHAGKILNLFIDEEIPAHTAFGDVKQLAFQILESRKFPELINFMKRKELDESQYEWDYYHELQQTFKKNLRQVFLNIAFESQSAQAALIASVEMFKTTFHQGKSLTQVDGRTIPLDVIPAQLKRYLYQHKQNGLIKKTKELNVNKYEFLAAILNMS